MTAVFRPGIRHVVERFALVEGRPGEAVRPRVSRPRKTVDRDSAREADVVELRHLVEGLAAGIVDRRPHDLDPVEPLDPRDHRVPAGDQQADVGIVDLALEVRRVEVGKDVVHPDERLAQGPGKTLCIRQPDQEGPDEAGAVRHRHGVDVFLGRSRFLQGVLDHETDPFDVLARGDLRHDAVVGPVEVNLAQDDIAENPAPVLHDGRRALVARAFYSENPHWAVFLSRSARTSASRAMRTPCASSVPSAARSISTTPLFCT